MYFLVFTFELLITFLLLWNNDFLTINSAHSLENNKFKHSFQSKPDWQVVNGTRVNIVDYSYMAFLYAMDYNLIDRACSSSIISEYYILTACHCVLNVTLPRNKILPVKYITVVVGFDYINYSILHNENNYYRADKVSVHPECFIETIAHDVAVVRVEKPIKLSSKVKPVKLPEPSLDVAAMLGPNAACSFVGFGLARHTKDPAAFPLLMRHITLHRTDLKKCLLHFVYKYFISDEKNFCMFNNWGQVSYGDSGSSMLYGTGENRFIVGIASDVNNGSLGTTAYSLFTRIDTNLDFIKKEMGELKKDSSAASLKFTLLLKHVVTVLYMYSYLTPVLTVTVV